MSIQIIVKILASRLTHVIFTVVNEVSIKGRQIIHGPLMVNEIIVWTLKKNHDF